jgi:hypothetical protein
VNPKERQAADSYNEGNALLNQQRYAGAIAAYDRAISLAPYFGPAYYNRALAHAYHGDREGALEDFREAAIHGFEADFFHETWLRYLCEYGGYRMALAVCEDRGIPPFQRYALEKALHASLQEQSFLLRERPEAGIQFSPASLPLLCAIGDLLRDRGAPDIPLVEDLLTEADNKGGTDLEIRWRLHYLLGALFASTYLETLEPIEGSTGLFFDADYVDDHAFFVSRDSEAGRALEALLLRHRPELAAEPDTQRFARFAQTQFEKAAHQLCAARRLRLTPAKAAPLNWGITQDLWRAYVDTTAYLKDFQAYTRAVASVRLYNALTGLRGWLGDSPGEAGRQAERLQHYFTVPAENSPDRSATERQLLLDYFVFEKASDTIVYGADAARHSEVGITRISPDAVTDLVAVSRQWEARAGMDAKEVFSSIRSIGLNPEGSLERAPSPLLEELDALLLGPVKEAIRRAGRLIIAPFGYLYNIPFHLLPTLRELIDQGILREVIYVPGTSFLPELRDRIPVDRRRASYLFVGGGMSISYEAELDAVRTLFPRVTALTGEQATCHSVIEALRNADVVHFACHGGFDHTRNCAYLQLPRERLYPGDLLEAEGLSPELVLLNACVTGVYRREARNGDASIGLPTAFLLAGARQVIGSLWPIDDAAAVAFATRFFEKWRREPDSSTAAIVLQTQREMSRKKEFEGVYYWGGYGLFGDAGS